ncbi:MULTISPECIES: SRPBCC family protein [Chryseobacterium]|uniref:Uncharacterized protein YndB with AHSA1/START domain n=1 Tax=Chryseobacterium camelliae TaxID=1265445 RepID=A0ABU0TH45_9FLAO|nr:MULTISPECIES: SRPBCC family protein [Chryseobacterium]MDT3406619.1 uncharacterized protein YndB with AHSA1/START domain [Pseudacidovorax intermedius]MDQ1095585.1 uncharacterized protein YndB with AHSA1/START domain [Chryseobacterium camelliae]MDQ1099521.1 uncharacterized protein YndB with AHSA1/START domain [Chryseobacterium sp. SORGH_AS_1048]MDR6086868.1 uncharacterized protein YndB with AHSA1/START domain [Chryseobacterium sp. SORGH_AS_0909]MDR6131240.1 uncharacterized protein YndB with A
MESITLEITILASAEKVWQYFNSPEHIIRWNFADETWHCPEAENNLKEGGTFRYRMEAKNGSFGFDFQGTYDEIVPEHRIKYHLDDGRKVKVLFEQIDAHTTKLIQTFEPENQNPIQMQRDGWYAIMNNFHKYVEENA